MANLTEYGYNDSSENCTDYDERFLETEISSYVVPTIFAIIFVIGVIGNGTTILIVLHNKQMRNVPNIFIVSLAAGDLILLLISVPFKATIYTFTIWPYGLAMCKITEYLQTLSLGISVFTLTVLSWDRYTAITRPMQKAKWNMLKRTCIMVVAIWLLAAVLASMDAYESHLVTVEMDCSRDVVYCAVFTTKTYNNFRTIFRFLIYFAIPIICICVFYILMALTLIQSSKQMLNEGQAGGTGTNKQTGARKNVAKVILSFVVVFVVCWLPHHIYIFWLRFDPNGYNLFWHIFKITGFCLSFINSCANPVALYLLSRQFRGYFHKYLLCCFHGTTRPERTVPRACNGVTIPHTGGYTCMTAKTRAKGGLYTYSNDTRLQKTSLSSDPEVRLKKTILSGDLM